FNKPASAFVARFIGGHNVLPAAGARGPSEAAFVAHRRAPLRVAGGGAACVAIRADRMSVAAGAAASVGASSIAGVARSVEYLGSTVQVGIDVIGLDDMSAVVAEARFDAQPARRGQAVAL